MGLRSTRQTSGIPILAFVFLCLSSSWTTDGLCRCAIDCWLLRKSRMNDSMTFCLHHALMTSSSGLKEIQPRQGSQAPYSNAEPHVLY